MLKSETNQIDAKKVNVPTQKVSLCPKIMTNGHYHSSLTPTTPPKQMSQAILNGEQLRKEIGECSGD